MNKHLKTLGASFSGATNGNTSSPSHSESRGILITLRVHSPKLVDSSRGTATDVTFWGRNFTLAELCMCTDYSPPASGQIPLPLELPPESSGEYFLTSLGVHKCVECRKMRPLHITALSTSVRS